MYEFISLIRPYFYSLREIETTICLDLKLPNTWLYEDIVSVYKTIKPLTQDKNDKVNLVSLISIADKQGYDVVFACAKEIIKLNKEREEKELLFQKKMKELHELFQNQPLDKLKELNINNLIDGQESTTRFGISPEGDSKGFDGLGLPKETDDKRVKKSRQAKIDTDSNSSNTNTKTETIVVG